MSIAGQADPARSPHLCFQIATAISTGDATDGPHLRVEEARHHLLRATGARADSTTLHRPGMKSGQRVWNGQPGGRLYG